MAEETGASTSSSSLAEVDDAATAALKAGLLAAPPPAPPPAPPAPAPPPSAAPLEESLEVSVDGVSKAAQEATERIARDAAALLANA